MVWCILLLGGINTFLLGLSTLFQTNLSLVHYILAPWMIVEATLYLFIGSCGLLKAANFFTCCAGGSCGQKG